MECCCYGMQTPAYLLGSQPIGSTAAAVVAVADVLVAAEPAVAAAAAETQAKERAFCR